jgi:Na+-transporting NADH:ubiquinone oxidoreductase subunit NqrF
MMEKPEKPKVYFFVKSLGFRKFRGNPEGREHVYTREEVYKNLDFEEAKRLAELLMAEMCEEFRKEVPSVQGFVVLVKPMPEPEFDGYVGGVPTEILEANNHTRKAEKVYVS